MLKKFQEMLHQYKLQVFNTEHGKQSTEEIAEECMELTEEILEEKFRYHFHKLPDANRAEIINMINNYTREAVLPPVVEKLVRRQVVLEKRVEALVRLMEQLFEVLSANQQGVGNAKG
jgi:hypothetical protein